MKFFFNEDAISGKVRGTQILSYLSEHYPDVVEKSNVEIFIKRDIGSNAGNAIKIVDLIDLELPLYKVSEADGFIVTNDVAKEYAERRTSKPVYVIPHHHCNFDDLRREDREVKTVGYIGAVDRLSILVDILRKKLEKHGFEFVTHFLTLEDSRDSVVDKYLGLDISLVFDNSSAKFSFPPELKNPLKVVNAGSFGIPTVGFRELAYRDVRMIEASNTHKIIVSCLALRDKSVYNPVATDCVEEAKKFHIKEIAKKYVEYFGGK